MLLTKGDKDEEGRMDGDNSMNKGTEAIAAQFLKNHNVPVGLE